MRIFYALSLAFALLISGADNLQAQSRPATPASITFGEIGTGTEGPVIKITFRYDLKNALDNKSLPASSDFRTKVRISPDGKPLVTGFDPAKTEIYLAGHRFAKPDGVIDVYGLNWNKDRWYKLTHLGNGLYGIDNVPIWYDILYDYQIIISDGPGVLWTPDPLQTLTDVNEPDSKNRRGNSRFYSKPSN
ncbi:MAG: hypothetical protein Q8P32_01855 [Candidatus Komeilibacteria bacterium]|nr:hypothetical protein [Candidatus Komeilibacteria bacterium]